MEAVNNIDSSADGATTTELSQSDSFTPAQALQSFSADFLNEEKCRLWILRQLHTEGASCPYCGHSIATERQIRRFASFKRLACKSCNKFFTATTGTFLQGSQLKPHEVFLLAVLLAAGVENKIIAQILKRNEETIRLWKLKFEAQEKMIA